MTQNFQNFIAGEWVAPATGAYFENRNPADRDDVIGCFPRSGPEDVKRAVAAAQRGFAQWSKTPAPLRGDVLHRVGDLLVQRKDEIARAMTREMGKVSAETRGDVQEGIDTAFYAHTEGRRLFGRTVPSELRSKWAMSYRRPIGVAGLITPFNFPLAIPTWKMFPALLCGNAVIFKPAEDVPHTAHLLEQDLHEQVRGVGDVFRRLEDHRVPAQQGWKHLPCRNRQREVERGDESRNSDRPPVAHRPLAAQLGGNSAPEQPPAFRVGVVRGVDPLLHVPSRLGHNPAHLPCPLACDVVVRPNLQMPDPVQHVAAQRRGGLRPLREAALRRGDGTPHVFGARSREAADHIVPVGGVAVLEIGARCGVHPLAGDEILEMLGHSRATVIWAPRPDTATGPPRWRQRAAALHGSAAGLPR